MLQETDWQPVYSINEGFSIIFSDNGSWYVGKFVCFYVKAINKEHRLSHNASELPLTYKHTNLYPLQTLFRV